MPAGLKVVPPQAFARPRRKKPWLKVHPAAAAPAAPPRPPPPPSPAAPPAPPPLRLPASGQWPHLRLRARAAPPAPPLLRRPPRRAQDRGCGAPRTPPPRAHPPG
eukprot:364723-Chlamydomonas_euryale.AAC.5